MYSTSFGNTSTFVKQSCIIDRTPKQEHYFIRIFWTEWQVEGKRPAGEGARKHTWSNLRVGGKQVRGVANHLQNLPSIRTRRCSYQQEDPRYQPETTPSNEALSRNLGSKGKGDATSSAETGQKGVRKRFCETY